jgi:hypothetical protein
MARRIVSVTTITPTATADTSNLVDSSYPFVLQGGSATQLIRVWEISISGQAPSSSSPTYMLQSRDAVVAVTSGTNITGFSDTPMDPATAALAAPPLTGDVFSGTKPQRSSTNHLQNCSLNAFGGVYFWRANRQEECASVLGSATPLGEQSLSAFTGGTPGAIGVHLVYEPLIWLISFGAGLFSLSLLQSAAALFT